MKFSNYQLSNKILSSVAFVMLVINVIITLVLWFSEEIKGIEFLGFSIALLALSIVMIVVALCRELILMSKK